MLSNGGEGGGLTRELQFRDAGAAVKWQHLTTGQNNVSRWALITG